MDGYKIMVGGQDGVREERVFPVVFDGVVCQVIAVLFV